MAQTALKLVGLDDRMDHFPRQLSGGQEQRVAIARAIVTDPDIILADEPTGNLDATSARDVLTLLQKLNKDFGKTVVMVTHDPHSAAAASQTDPPRQRPVRRSAQRHCCGVNALFHRFFILLWWHAIMHKSGRGAFTLIELLVVIAIITILIGILAPTIERVRHKGYIEACAANLHSIGQAMTMYANDNHGSFPRATYDPERLRQPGPRATTSNPSEPLSGPARCPTT